MADPRGDYYVVQGALTFAKRENFAYAACATCNKKVFESGGTFTCETCQKTLDSSGVTQRSLASLLECVGAGGKNQECPTDSVQSNFVR